MHAVMTAAALTLRRRRHLEPFELAPSAAADQRYLVLPATGPPHLHSRADATPLDPPRRRGCGTRGCMMMALAAAAAGGTTLQQLPGGGLLRCLSTALRGRHSMQHHAGGRSFTSSSPGAAAHADAPRPSSAGTPYDVCIVGAGMVGAALAALLRAHPLTASMRIALIDQQVPPMTLETHQHPDMCVSTITPANMQLLQQAGAWQELEQLAPTFEHMQVWEFAGPSFISWASSEVGLPHMGCVVENRLLQAALLRAATAASGSGSGCLDLLCPQSVQALRLPGGGGGSETPPLQQLLLQQPAGSADGGSSSSLAELQLADGSSLQCRLVVAADGARSRVRQLAGFRTVGWSYSQRGLVATVATSEPNDTAWQRFLPSGPLALLPVRGGYSNVVWTVTPEMARQLEGYSSSQFADAVNAALQPDPASFAVSSSSSSAGAGFSAAAAAAGSVLQGVLSRAPVLGPVLGGVAAGPLAAEAGSFWRQPPLVQGWVGSSPKSFPLQLQHSGRYVAPRLALIGDAAHAVHPLAGQGVNLGLGDAAALASALAFAREAGQDVGSSMLLASRYEAQRQRANVGMMAALEGLWRAFGVQDARVGALREAGLGALNAVGPLKNSIMRYAMGL